MVDINEQKKESIDIVIGMAKISNLIKKIPKTLEEIKHLDQLDIKEDRYLGLI